MAVTSVGGRQRPRPLGRPVMRQRWCDLLFAHWPAPKELLGSLLPCGLELDLFEGQAWLGVVPFRMEGVGLFAGPGVPGASHFLELNVRTYVVRDGKPGVWFFSLDAASRLAVRTARRFFGLPYFDARMRQTGDEGGFRYLSRRTHRNAAPALLQVRYRPRGEPMNVRSGSIDEWLTARYCLYATMASGHLIRCEIDHLPWTLQPAEAVFGVNAMGGQLGLPLDEKPAYLHFSRQIAVVNWLPQRVDG